MKIIDDVFVLTDVESDKFFVSNCFGFDVFGSVRVLESVDRFFKLAA